MFQKAQKHSVFGREHVSKQEKIKQNPLCDSNPLPDRTVVSRRTTKLFLDDNREEISWVCRAARIFKLYWLFLVIVRVFFLFCFVLPIFLFNGISSIPHIWVMKSPDSFILKITLFQFDYSYFNPTAVRTHSSQAFVQNSLSTRNRDSFPMRWWRQRVKPGFPEAWW